MNRRHTKLFAPGKAIGVVCGDAPAIICQNPKSWDKGDVFCSADNVICTYRAGSLKRRCVSDCLPQVPVCIAQAYIAAEGTCLYAGFDGGITIVKNYRKILKTVAIEGCPTHMISFGHVLVVSCQPANTLLVLNASDGEPVLNMTFPPGSKITSLSHPATYLDKVLVGLSNGQIQLINVKSGKVVHKFTKLNDKTAVTYMQQSPVTDVYAIGFESGVICLYNIKYEQLLFTGSQEGAVTAIAFRTDGVDTMLTGNSSGCISVWSLDEKRLLGQLREAHRGRITSLHTLSGEPYCISTGSDNRIVNWVFQAEMSMPEIHTVAEGHSDQINCVKFYNELRILTAGADGSLRSFHAVRDDIFKNLGTVIKKLDKSSHVKENVINMDTHWVRASSWDDVVCLHEKNATVSSWSTRRQAVGNKVFCHPRFYKSPRFVQHMASCIRLSACGNMVFIGYTSGHIDIFNVQSGLYRGSLKDVSISERNHERAHDYPICGVESDFLSARLVSCDVNGIMKFWDLKTHKYEGKLRLSSCATKTILDRRTRLCAVALKSGDIQVIDIDFKRTARQFEGAHSAEICDMAFSPDGRWIVASDKHGYVKVWDVITVTLIDAMKFEHVCLGLSFSERGTYLATVHEGLRGVYTWGNMAVFTATPDTSTIPNDDNSIALAVLPSIIHMEGPKSISSEARQHDEDSRPVVPMEVERDLTHSDEFIKFSGLPSSRWFNLPFMRLINLRNKPKDAPKKPATAPFFLPCAETLDGFEFAKENKDDKSAVDREKKLMAKRSGLEIDTVLLQNLLECADGDSNDGYLKALENLTQANLLSIDFQIKSLPSHAFTAFLRMCRIGLESTVNFELIQAYLAVMLKYHGTKLWKVVPDDLIDDQPHDADDLNKEIESLHKVLVDKWSQLEADFFYNKVVIKWLQDSRFK
uniref:Utp21 domain-containing protein n=1 Tax=Steinernema glaseri TaxID=37863 RepID=A0A1I7YX49_9BILA